MLPQLLFYGSFIIIQVMCGIYDLEISSLKDKSALQLKRDIYDISVSAESIDNIQINNESKNSNEFYDSPIIFSEKAPITINFKMKPKSTSSIFRSKNSNPIVLSNGGTVVVNYDYKNTAKVMVEMPSGIIMSYLKFKTISCYLPEELKSDVSVLIDDEKMSYKQFEEMLRLNNCNDMEDNESCCSLDEDYITLNDGTEVNLDVYSKILTSISNGSETLMIPNVFNGLYSTYAILLATKLPELTESAIVITSSGYRVPFNLYYAVDKENFQRSSNNQDIKQICWHDGTTVNVQTIRNIINALKNPESINYVFPNGKKLPFIPKDNEECWQFHNINPAEVQVDICRYRHVPLLIFNDIVAAVHIPDITIKEQPSTCYPDPDTI
ncbi:uncharacterized protein LOC126902620 isoform X2 [Daktulosphaira vitifoliae]|uniref:uncharacterized protein LOC126902620 isoform X2 n=1 Tax=Daktulosphaira vitifoliae TaxID=58002 RepID=UPI0021AA41F0|nr:uncharacterized protein LOC126902620 isoform X2 [Daktulosphaira vitifoliae]